MEINLEHIITGSGFITTVFVLFKNKQILSIFRKLKKKLGLLQTVSNIVDETVKNELNTISNEDISMLKKHALIDNITSLINLKIPNIYLHSKKQKPQTLFALCSIILMQCYLESYIEQFTRLDNNRVANKQIAELEVLQQLKLVIIKSIENMEKEHIPPLVISIFFEWYTIEVNQLYSTLYDNLQIAKTYKDTLTCTLYTCNYFVYSMEDMFRNKIDKFNGDVSQYLTDEIYNKISLDKYRFI